VPLQTWLTRSFLEKDQQHEKKLREEQKLWKPRFAALERLANDHYLLNHPRPQGCSSTATGLGQDELKQVLEAGLVENYNDEEDEGEEEEADLSHQPSLWKRFKPF